MRPIDPRALGPILILAPIGRDATEIGRILGGMGVPSRAPGNLAALCAEMRSDGGAAVAGLLIAEEALAGGVEALVACLARQPPWSDLPVVVLTASGRRRGPGGRWALFEGLGNVTLLDRPLHAEALRSAARAALRARARQHETRHHLEALRIAAETLEARVEERTRALMAEVAERTAAQERLRQTQKMEAPGPARGRRGARLQQRVRRGAGGHRAAGEAPRRRARRGGAGRDAPAGRAARRRRAGRRGFAPPARLFPPREAEGRRSRPGRIAGRDGGHARQRARAGDQGAGGCAGRAAGAAGGPAAARDGADQPRHQRPRRDAARGRRGRLRRRA